ncbi:2-keto-4-pentenoate hydratase [Aliidongia dinghuensis]|uniref:2-keto-4-pentenoate hydratase n=1 Tax=Aliidongia dinghuensis TaxID=1867774 RepID=A0A8J2Z1H4_9PROT|nr:fumarylacetoacetate hydrolase family protein [Aliidongia dinghuensis]GGF49356.1 2-keto-4-pentenoate hydratase [Aliidongia dinghuensis]
MHAEILAERLRQAYLKGGVPPLRDGLAPNDAAAAYAVQALNTQIWISEGRRVVGRKIGLTSRSVQAQLGVDQPDYGTLFADMLIEDGGVLLASRVLQPKAEAEVALVLRDSIDDRRATPEAVRAATDYIVAAIEIVDSRIADWKITFADTVADNGSSAFFVLGRERRRLAGLDLRSCTMRLEVNGQTASEGVGAACMGDPLIAAAWLARTFAEAGEPLQAGDIILSGALGPMVPLTPGDGVKAVIDGLGEVAFSFRNDRQ